MNHKVSQVRQCFKVLLGKALSNCSLEALKMPHHESMPVNLRKPHNSIGSPALDRNFLFRSMDGIEININALADCCKPVCDVKEGERRVSTV